MKSLFLFFSLVCFVSFPASAQFDEPDTVTTNVAPSMFGFGIQGGPTLIDPEYINNQIEYVNDATSSSMRPIRSAAMWSAWISIRPKNVFNYISFRAEMLSNERTFSSVTNQTDQNGTVVNSVTTTTKTNYTLYPLSVNVGGVLPKTTTKLEIGLVYAFSTIDEEGSISTGSGFSRIMDGEGYGARIAMQFWFPLEKKLGLTVDVGYRYLRLEDYRDERGYELKNFEADYSGIIFSLGLAYGI